MPKKVTAVKIALALANCGLPFDWDNGTCTLCWQDISTRPERRDLLEPHDAECPWRMAREWVRQNAEESDSKAGR